MLMPDLGPHAAFIWASYAAVVVVLAGLIGWLAADGRKQQRLLADLESRGGRRRSASGGAG
jgi:heme exporter protein D